ncbi:hypothetical protein [Catenulispora subtropica]|uniref:Uncharacterized protein n=1 Tax=Catenulispora subtropica TaxID=450798 RepID=A0ABN2TCD1_9ACTN
MSSATKTVRPRCREFLAGMVIGFAGALAVPARRGRHEPAAPPAPRPRDVQIQAPHEEPVPVRPHRAA